MNGSEKPEVVFVPMDGRPGYYIPVVIKRRKSATAVIGTNSLKFELGRWRITEDRILATPVGEALLPDATVSINSDGFCVQGKASKVTHVLVIEVASIESTG